MKGTEIDSLTELSQVLGIPETELRSAAEEELRKRTSANLALEEPWIFQRDYLCSPSQRGLLRPFHKEGLGWLCQPNGKRLKLILWPRGHLKSTIFTQGETVRRLLANPNLRVLIKSSTTELAQGFLTAIKGHLADPRITGIFGDLLPNNRSGAQFKNNQDELTILTRNQFHLKEPSVTVSGLDATKTSQHYDLIICDDLVCRENVGSFEMMDKVWTVWQDLLDLLEPDGLMLVIGTRWHPLDLYGRILSDYVDPQCFDGVKTLHQPNCSCHFDVSILELRDPDGNYIFDSKFDDEKAKLLLEVKGSKEFSAQYLNNPLNESSLWFKHDQIAKSLVSPAEIQAIRDRLVWYMMVDPAESEEMRSSFTSIVCCGVDHDTGIVYVDYAKQLRVNTEGFITAVFNAVTEMNPHRFGMEKKTRKALEYVLKDKMAQYGRFWTIEDLDPMLGNTPNAKEVRIKMLQPLFEHGRIKVNNSLTDLVKILQTIPSSHSWDLPDALSYIFQLIPKGLGAQTTPKADNLPVYVTQNKGLHYAVSRKRRHSRHQSGTQSAYGLGSFYSSVRSH